MRDFTKISPLIWRSEKFKSLGSNDDAKLVYFYVLSSPHSNSAGCYDLLLGYGSSDLKWEIKRYRKAIERLSDADLIAFDWQEETVRIVNWANFNPPTNAKHALGILSQLRQASSGEQKSLAAQEFREALAQKGFKDLRAVEAVIDSLLKGYRKGIPTETRDRDQTERETRPDRDIDLEAQKENLRGAGSTAPPNGASPPPLVDRLETKFLQRTAAK